MEKIKEARMIIWLKMSKLDYQINSQNYSNDKIIFGKEIDKNLKNTLKERENIYGAGSSNQGGKKAGDTGAKKKDEKMAKITRINFNSVIEYNSQSSSLNSSSSILEKPSKELNDSDEGFNIYFKYTDLISKVDLRFVYFQLTNPQLSSNRLNLDSIASVLNDLQIISNKSLYPHSSFKITLLFLQAKLLKLNFLYDLHDYLKEKMTKLLKSNFSSTEIASTREVMLKFSNYYNQRCSQVWSKLLFKSKDNLEKCISLLKGEFYTFSLKLELHQILLELSDVNILLAEYRPSLNPKYCDVNQIIRKINNLAKSSKFYDKENDDLPYLNESEIEMDLKMEKSNWMDEKIKQDKILVRNLIRSSVYFSEIASKIILIKKLLNENLHDLAMANLIDPSKLPKDISLAILENDFIIKKKNKMFLNSINQKASPDSFDVYYYFKNVVKETEFFTIDNEEISKNISKLHKYLKLNSTNYANKCYLEINPLVDTNDMNLEIIKKDAIITNWIINPNEVVNSVSDLEIDDGVNLVYVLGPNSVLSEFKDFVYGRVLCSRKNLKVVNKKLIELKNSLRNSLGLSEGRKKRDLKYLQMEYDEIVMDIAFELFRIKSKKKLIKIIFINFYTKFL